MEEVDDVLVRVSQVEDSCDLDIEILFIGLFPLDALVDHMDLVVSLLKYLRIPLSEGLLEFSMMVLNLLSS